MDLILEKRGCLVCSTDGCCRECGCVGERVCCCGSVEGRGGCKRAGWVEKSRECLRCGTWEWDAGRRGSEGGYAELESRSVWLSGLFTREWRGGVVRRNCRYSKGCLNMCVLSCLSCVGVVTRLLISLDNICSLTEDLILSLEKNSIN